MVWPVVDEALKNADKRLEDLSAIAVCHGPGLIGSLLVGCSFAKAVCFARNIPLVSVNHLEGHIFSCFLDRTEGGGMPELYQRVPQFPFIALIVSGGHTSLYRVDGFGRYTELGRTRDDAAGEAYDKVSKLLGLGYPGGPAIDKFAGEGDPEKVNFPRAYLPNDLDFSFSGLKTSVLNYLRKIRGGEMSTLFSDSGLSTISDELLKDICASFQQAVIDVLVRKTEWAMKRERITAAAVSGGVGANSSLRKELALMAERNGFTLFIPPVYLCTDNAAMISAAGYHHFVSGRTAGVDLNPVAYLLL